MNLARDIKLPSQFHRHSRRAYVKLSALSVGTLKHNLSSSEGSLEDSNDEERSVPSWIPMPSPSQLGLHCIQFRSLRLLKKEFLTYDSKSRKVFLFRFAFHRTQQELWCLPGDYFILQFVGKDGKVHSRPYTPIYVQNKGHIDLVIKVSYSFVTLQCVVIICCNEIFIALFLSS
jgi:hypothetical protein